MKKRLMLLVVAIATMVLYSYQKEFMVMVESHDATWCSVAYRYYFAPNAIFNSIGLHLVL